MQQYYPMQIPLTLLALGLIPPAQDVRNFHDVKFAFSQLLFVFASKGVIHETNNLAETAFKLCDVDYDEPATLIWLGLKTEEDLRIIMLHFCKKREEEENDKDLQLLTKTKSQ